MSYVETLVAIRRSSSDDNIGSASKATFPSESLKRSWDMAFDAATAEDALASHEVIEGFSQQRSRYEGHGLAASDEAGRSPLFAPATSRLR